GSVGENLIIGGLLALLILFLFLRSFKMTLAIGISIPLALVGTFVAMYFMGINLNIVSMSGLALAVGMLVDNSVVVLENIYRLRSKGFQLKDACIKGASQIMLAMLASSLTTICVFFPMFFLEGLIMQMFTDLIWVVILSLLCSFVVAVMFLPSIVSTFKINPKTPKAVVAAEGKVSFWQKVRSGWGKFTGGANHVFDKVLRFAINKKWLTVILAVVLFAGSACMLLINGFILIPSTDEGSLTVSATLNSVGQSVSAADKKEVLAQPLYEKVVDVLGNDLEKCVVEYDTGSSILSNGIQMAVEIKLKDQRSLTTDQASEKLFKAFQGFDRKYYDDIDVTTSSMASSLVSSDVSVTLSVDADNYTDAFSTLGQFGNALNTKFASQIEELNIRTLVYDDYMDGVKQIIKSNGKYASVIKIKANASADTNKIQTLLNQYLDELMHSDQFKDTGIVVLDNGMQEQMDQSYSSMGMALFVGFLLIYLVMVAIFQSFLMPFIILICVPLGFTGAFLLLTICGIPLSIPALIGLLILMGVVINNGILAVDYTNQARRDGLSVKEALVSAMHTRMRPIFMTALTTILAMVPMAFGWSLFNPGGSSAMMQPLAVVSIGGLLFGTVTTLIVVPAFYAIFCRNKKMTTTVK
ncbi:MAG: efflux RND transporter permease subunit, partial [Clostridia bacterium]|nr:efflux RND transporter permease subunit [Clostridia bacterium]